VQFTWPGDGAKVKQFIFILLVSTLLIPVSMNKSFADEDIFNQSPSCHKHFISERNDYLIGTGISGAVMIVSAVFPPALLVNLLTIPAGAVSTVRAFKMNNMAKLIEQAYAGSGSLLDELVEDVQNAVPGKTRDEIIAALIKADQTLALCPPDSGESKFSPWIMTAKTFSDTVAMLSSPDHPVYANESQTKKLSEIQTAAAEYFDLRAYSGE
jgi:hypothetical protein